MTQNLHSTDSKENKNALTAVVRLACLEIKSWNEEAINSTRKRIYSLKVFFTSYLIDVNTSYLFLNWFSTLVSDDQKYVCGRRLYACINTRKFTDLDSREITSLPKKWFTCHVISIIAENKPHAHHKTICMQWKVTTADHRSFVN